MSNAAISVKGLKKSYKDKEVLKGVDFEVRHGEIFALLGSNGAGKTTAVNILSTLMKPDGGEAAICGFDSQRQPDHVRQSISLTGQFAALDGMLTGRENLMMIAKLRGVSNPAQVADNLLAKFSLTDAANRRADQYSGGMKRRNTIKELAGSGTTILLTTQYLEEAEQLADRIAILHGGKIITTGTLSELKEMFPPAKVEYIEKQPTLEEIFLAIIGKKEEK